GSFSAIGKSDVDHRGTLSSLADTNRRKRGSLRINVEPCQGNRRRAGDSPPLWRLEPELLDHRSSGVVGVSNPLRLHDDIGDVGPVLACTAVRPFAEIGRLGARQDVPDRSPPYA